MPLKPMLSKTGSREILDDEHYIFEAKLDGIRAICEYRNGKPEFYNRHGQPIGGTYPEFAFADHIKAKQCILDGEIIMLNEKGNPDFHLLMRRHQRKLGLGKNYKPLPIIYVAFDILQLNGRDLTGLPLLERKEILPEVVTEGKHLQLSVFTENGPKLWKMMMQHDQEGVIAKKKGSHYHPGKRRADWLKVKTFNTVDFVIAGYRAGKNELASLGLALYDQKKLRFFGRVGTGFSEATRAELLGLLKPLETGKSPSSDYPPSYDDMIWVKPQLVAEVRFLEIGSQGMLRHPSFIRLRPDKNPQDCQTDQLSSSENA